MFARFGHPPAPFGVSCQLKEPSENGKTVVSAESQSNRIRPESIGKSARIVVDTPDRLSDDLCYPFRVLPVPEEVRGDARRPGDRQAAQAHPLAVAQREHVNPHIRAARLMASRNREVVVISWQVSQVEH
jgi:hypothetical protein